MVNPVVIIRSVRVTNYEGISLGTLAGSEVQIFDIEEAAKASSIDGDVPEKVIETAKWFLDNDRSVEYKTAADGAGLSIQRGGKLAPLERTTLASIQSENEGELPDPSEKAKFYIIPRATISFINA